MKQVEKIAGMVIEKLVERLTPQFPVVTIKTFLDEYESFVRMNRSAKTLRGVMLVSKKLLKYYSADRVMNTIMLKDLETFLDIQKRKAPRGVYVYLRVLKAMFNKAKEWNYVQENPVGKIRLAKRQSVKKEFITDEQFEKILSHISTDMIKDFIVLAFYTACRLSELTFMKWCDVDFIRNVIVIGSESFQTKSRKQREVPMHSKVREVLLARAKRIMVNGKWEMLDGKTHPLIPSKEGIEKRRGGDRNGFVFCKGNGFAFTPDYFSKQFKCACKAAGFGNTYHFHDLRHSALSRMILKGAPLPVVQRISGHAQLSTLSIYLHPDLDSMREAVNRM
ncbi:MAG: site-specific integrase [Ignavibacteriales bacterium]|nr:MAG: site-specific integrase [Ignavibacteriales bacterium]